MFSRSQSEKEKQLVSTRTFVGELLYFSSQVYTAVADLAKFQPDEPQRIGQLFVMDSIGGFHLEEIRTQFEIRRIHVNRFDEHVALENGDQVTDFRLQQTGPPKMFFISMRRRQQHNKMSEKYVITSE